MGSMGAAGLVVIVKVLIADIAKHPSKAARSLPAAQAAMELAELHTMSQ